MLEEEKNRNKRRRGLVSVGGGEGQET